MGLFDQFPYTNFHELNLDWILKALKELETTIEQFVSINSLKYADPIDWNITSQYEKNTIVVNPQTGTAYISITAVPSGIDLSNTDYWTPVFNMEYFIRNIVKNFTSHYEESSTSTATMSTSAGEWLIWGDSLYRALNNINVGDAYVNNGNIEHITIENVIGYLFNLHTTTKSNIVAAINETFDNIVTEATNRQAADTALQTSINNEAQDRQYADTALQINIDNEAQTRQAADTALQTNINNEAQARQAADTALQTNINNVAKLVSGRKYLIIGDSYSQNNAWQQYLHDINSDLVIDDNIITVAYGGTGFTATNDGYNFSSMLSLVTTKLNELGLSDSDITDIVFLGGINDNLSSLNDEVDAIANCLNAYKDRFSSAKYHLVPCASHTYPDVRLRMRRNVINAWLNANATVYPHAPMFIHSVSDFQTDGLHPSASGMKKLAHYFNNAVINGIESISPRYGNAGMVAGDSGNTVGSNAFELTEIANRLMLRFSGGSVTFGTPITWTDNGIYYLGDLAIGNLEILPTATDAENSTGIIDYMDVALTLRNSDNNLNVCSHAYLVFDWTHLSSGSTRVYLCVGNGATPYNVTVKGLSIAAFEKVINY